jgi:hypothetical protein
MSFSQQEKDFIEKADKFIVSLDYGTWKSTWRYSQPRLFMQLLEEYEKVYEIQYDNSRQKFRKIKSLL